MHGVGILLGAPAAPWLARKAHGGAMSPLITLPMGSAGVAALFARAGMTWSGGSAMILPGAGMIAVSAVAATAGNGTRRTRPLSELGATA